MNNKPVVDARTLIARLSREGEALQKREIIAPLLPGGKIRTRLGKLVYDFKVKALFSGWGRFRPLDERRAELLGEALPWQRAGYLELLPALRVVLLWPIEKGEKQREQKLNPGRGAWWALPYNEGDAAQRFGFSPGEMLPVYLCDPQDGANRFERVIARVSGNTLWFDGLDVSSDPAQAEWLRDQSTNEALPERYLSGLSSSQRRALLFWFIRRIELVTAAERASFEGKSTHEQQKLLKQWLGRSKLEVALRHSLAKADAVLHSFQEIPGEDSQLVVEWSQRGQHFRYRSTIERGLSVVSSGICLSGRDHDFDLTSLVSVMADNDY